LLRGFSPSEPIDTFLPPQKTNVPVDSLPPLRCFVPGEPATKFRERKSFLIFVGAFSDNSAGLLRPFPDCDFPFTPTSRSFPPSNCTIGLPHPFLRLVLEPPCDSRRVVPFPSTPGFSPSNDLPSFVKKVSFFPSLQVKYPPKPAPPKNTPGTFVLMIGLAPLVWVS